MEYLQIRHSELCRRVGALASNIHFLGRGRRSGGISQAHKQYPVLGRLQGVIDLGPHGPDF